MPPAGMCRIWVQGVPANKQPAPTDCATAIKNNPANGRVIFGPTKDSTRAGGVSQLLRGRGLLPVGPLRGNPAQARALVNPSSAAARRDSAARSDSADKRDSTAKRDSTIKRDTTIRRDTLR